jgi:hypothetical protein
VNKCELGASLDAFRNIVLPNNKVQSTDGVPQ